MSAYAIRPFPTISSLLILTIYFSNALVIMSVHFSLYFPERGNIYLTLKFNGILSSISTFTYLPIYNSLTQYFPDLFNWGTPFYWGYIFFQIGSPLYTSTKFLCFIICNCEPIQIASLHMYFLIMMSLILTSLT